VGFRKGERQRESRTAASFPEILIESVHQHLTTSCPLGCDFSHTRSTSTPA